MIKQTLVALSLALVLAAAPALANDHAAAPAADAAMAPAAAAPAMEKCEVMKDGKATVSEVAVGECEKSGGKVVTDAPKAEEKKEEKKAE